MESSSHMQPASEFKHPEEQMDAETKIAQSPEIQHPDLAVEQLDPGLKIGEMTEDAQKLKLEFEQRATEKAHKPRRRRPTISPGEGRSFEDDNGLDLVRLHLDQIGEDPLLTKDDEVALAKLIVYGKEASEMLESERDEITGRQRTKARKLVREGEWAKEKFIKSNLRLVVSIAKRYQASGLPLPDLIQEGYLGLIHSVDKFDYRKGFKFSTYATWWIRQAITRGIANTGRTIRLPVHAGDTLARLNKARARLELKLGRDATRAELAEESDMTEEEVEIVQSYPPEPVSLELPLNKENPEATLADTVEDKNSTHEYERAEQRTANTAIEGSLSILNEREQQVLILRYGLDRGETRTLEEVGQFFGLTRERIRQIEARAFSKLRHPSASNSELRQYLP